MVIVVVEIVMDSGFEGRHALKGAAANPSGRDRGEEAFHLIEPARTRRGEMQVVARMAHKPANDLGRFVRPVVIHDDVDVAAGWQLGVDAFEKFQKTPDGDGDDGSGQ